MGEGRQAAKQKTPRPSTKGWMESWTLELLEWHYVLIEEEDEEEEEQEEMEVTVIFLL